MRKNKVSVRTLQRFAGKYISFMLAVPGAKLYTRIVNAAISEATKQHIATVKVTPDIISEIKSWDFLGCAHMTIATDASAFKYGFVINPGCDFEQTSGDFWTANDQRPINLKEAEAVLKALLSTGESVRNCCLDVLCDNQAVVSAWTGQGRKVT